MEKQVSCQICLYFVKSEICFRKALIFLDLRDENDCLLYIDTKWTQRYNLLCITMLILLASWLFFLKGKGCTKGRRGNARSGLLEQGSAEQTDLFSDVLSRAARRSCLLFHQINNPDKGRCVLYIVT